MTRRQSLALDPYPTGWRRAENRLMAALERAHLALKRMEARMQASTQWMDRPGPSEDTAAMQPELPGAQS